MMIINRNNEVSQTQGNYAGGESSQKPKPVPGAYVCKIMGCQEGVTRDGDPVMHINVDIYEGELANYYRDLFSRSKYEPKHWGCVFNIYTPVKPWQQEKINKFIDAIEVSNPGYKWDNDWNGLIGKLIGLSFRNEQYRSFWVDNGTREVPSGWKVRPKDPYSVQEVRAGTVKTPADKPLPENQAQGQQDSFNQVPNYGGQPEYATQPVPEQAQQYAQPAAAQAVPQGTPQDMQNPAGSVDSFELLDETDESELPF